MRPSPGRASVTLHVTNGGSTAGTLRATGLEGDVLSWDDVLHEGPVPALEPERLREVRAGFLGDCGWGSRQEILGDLERRDRLLAEALAERRHVVLWFEHDLYDQLQLLQILALAGDVGPDPERFELIGVGEFDGRPDFHGLGELTADELETLWPLRRPVTGELVELGRRSWDAFRAPDPTALEKLLAGDTSPLPFLAPALRRLLEELPDERSGLARTERHLLEALSEGPRTPVQLFLASQERERRRSPATRGCGGGWRSSAAAGGRWSRAPEAAWCRRRRRAATGKRSARPGSSSPATAATCSRAVPTEPRCSGSTAGSAAFTCGRDTSSGVEEGLPWGRPSSAELSSRRRRGCGSRRPRAGRTARRSAASPTPARRCRGSRRGLRTRPGAACP